jgi:protein arginine kinase activator
MLCQKCHSEVATVHYTEIRGDEMIEKHLCEKCARDKGMTNPLKEIKFTIKDFLEGMLETEKTDDSPTCAVCGLTYNQFKEWGRLGCSECYNTFVSSLRPLFRRIHGASRHIGKSPAEDGDRSKQIHEIRLLRQQLKDAVAGENFEEAARLRDSIREIEETQE